VLKDASQFGAPVPLDESGRISAKPEAVADFVVEAAVTSGRDTSPEAIDNFFVNPSLDFTRPVYKAGQIAGAVPVYVVQVDASTPPVSLTETEYVDCLTRVGIRNGMSEVDARARALVIAGADRRVKVATPNSPLYGSEYQVP
jgi:hypothetical protein